MIPSFHTPEQTRPGRAIDRTVVTACLLALATVLQAAIGLDTRESSTRGLPGPAPAKEPVGESALLRAKLDEAQAAVAALQADAVATTNLPAGATSREVIDYRSALHMLATTYQAHLDTLALIEDIRRRRQDVSTLVRSWQGFDEPPPYSIHFSDDLRDNVQALEDKIQLGRNALAFVEKLAANVAMSMKGYESELRRLNEQLEEKPDPAQAVRLNWLRELAQARGRLSAASLASFDAIRQRTEEELAENRLRLELAQKQLLEATRHVSFTQADLDRALETLSRERLQLEAEAQQAAAELKMSKAALAAAREALQLAQRAPAQPAGDAAPSRLQEVVDVRETQEQTDAETCAGIRQLLDGNSLDHQLWQLRFAIFNTRDEAELQAAGLRLERLSDLAGAARTYFAQKAALADTLVAEQQNRLSSALEAQRDRALLQERLSSLQKRARLYRRVLERAELRGRLIQRWREALDIRQTSLPLRDRARHFLGETTRYFATLWNFELFVAEDTITVDGQKITGRRGITVGKVVQALLILVIGYGLSSCVARNLQRLAARRLGVEQNQANLIRRWILVALMTVLSVFSLILVKIPLTVFTFAGGALAIGFGFGMQNLIKNFISGIIILFERPFRVGDVLDIDGRCGAVTSIGFRSSIVQFRDGTETLIPNSSLLENNLTNWTFSNQCVRFTVALGVAYGTDTATVNRLLEEVTERHGLVRKEPAPQVLFTAFGDSTLGFEIRFWVDVSKHNAAQVASDLRHMIAKTFAEHGINMSFPQRDLHWDDKPLQVRLTRAEVAAPEPQA